MMKTMLKKLTALILAVALCASFAVMPSMAAEVSDESAASAVVTIGNAEITEAGTYVEVPVSVAFSSADVRVDAFGFEFSFNSEDLCIHTPANSFDSAVSLTNALCPSVTASASEQTVTYANANPDYLSQAGIDNFGTNVMFYLKVEAKEGFTNGTYTLDADLIDGLGANFSCNKQPVDVVIKPGTITLNAPSELEYPLNMLDINIPTDAVYDGTAHSVTVTPKAGSGLTVYAVYYQKEGTNITTAAPYNAGEYTISADVYDGTTVYSKLEVGTMTVEKATLPDIVAVSGLKYSSVYQVLFKIPDGFDSTYYAAGSTVPYIVGASLSSFTAQNPDTGVAKSAFNVKSQTGIWAVSYKVNSKYAENYQLVDGDANRIVYGFVRADGKATGAPGRSYLVSKPVDPQESFVYDGQSHSPNPPVKNSFTYMTYSKFTAQKDVGEYTYRYTLTANYEWADATSDWEALAPHIITWKITPAVPTINVDTSFVVAPGDSFTLGGTATGLSNLNHNLTAGLTYSVPEGSPLVVDETTGVVTVPETTAVGAYTVYVTYVPTTAAPYKNYAETTVPVTVVVNNVRVSLPSVSKTYNGNPIEVTDLFDGPASVTEDGQPLEGTVTYVFGGQTYSSWEALSAATVTDAGDYTLAVTYVSSDLSVTVTKNFVSTVERLQVEIPAPLIGLVYDGNEQSGFDEAALNNTYYTHSGITAATDSGTYYASFTLKDTANTCWSDGTVAVKQIAWTIMTVAGVSIPEMPEYNYVYDGATTYTCPLVPGEDALYTMTGTTTGKTPSPYSVTLTPKANYAWADLQPGDPGYKEEYAEYYGTSKSIKLTWNIQRADPVVNYTEIDVVLDGPTVSLKDALTGLPGLGHDLSAVVQKQSDYPAWAANGSVRYLTYTNPYDTSVIKVSASSGNITATQEGMYLITVSYDNHNWNPAGYGYATYYNSKSVTVIVHVKPKDEVNIDFAATTPSATYTGEAFTLGSFFTVPATVTGMDDAVVTYTFNGTVYTWEELLEQTVTDIGDYTVAARYEDDTHIGETVATFKVTGIPIPEDMMPQWDPDNLTFVYDGTRKEPIIVPAGSEAYYGINVSHGRTSAVDAGVYTVKFYLKDGNTCWPDGSRLPLEITWTIQRAPLAVKPVDQDIKMPYTGQQQHTPYQNGQYYTVMGNVAAVNADSYVSKATPDANYAWEDGTTDPVNLNWTITKINPVVHVNMSGAFGEFFTTPGNSIPISEIMSGLAGDDLTPFITVSEVGVSDAVYYDEGNHVLVVPAGADIGARDMFRVSYTAPILDDVGGDVTLYGRMNSYQNYELYVYINVVEAGVAEITFAANPNAITYTGSPISLGQFFHNPATADALGTITYDFGGETGLTWEQLLTKTVTEVGTYEVTANLVGYAHTGTKTVTFQVTKANQAPITISGNAGMKVGEQQVLTVSGGSTGGAITWAIKSGSEFASISAGGALSAHKAGTVVVTATMAGNGTYEAVSTEFTVVISRNQVATPEALIKTDLVYNAEEQTALAVADNAPYTVTGHKQTDAGTYELTVSLTDTDSFEWTDGTTEPKTFSWSIAKAELSVSGLTWNYTAPFTYADGVTHTVVLNTLAGVSDKIDVEYTNASAVDAGTYTASAAVTVNEANAKNYKVVNADKVPTCTWTINPQFIDLSQYDIKWNSDGKLVYNGQVQSVELLNVPADLVEVEYTNNPEARVPHVNSATDVGKYFALATLKAKDSNHTLDGNSSTVWSLNWEITPKPVDVPTVSDLVFNGEVQTVFTAPEGAVYTVVEGNTGKDAGQYTMTLSLISGNYKWNDNAGGLTRAVRWHINKGNFADLTVSGTYKRAETGTRTLPIVGLPTDAGTMTYGTREHISGDPGIVSIMQVEDGNVVLKLTGQSVAGASTVQRFKVTSKNYNDFYIVVNVTLQGKDEPAVQANDINVTYGYNPAGIAVTGTATYDGETLDGTWSLVTEDFSDMQNVGTYTVRVKFTPANADDYKAVECDAVLVVSPAPIDVSGLTWNYAAPFTYAEGVTRTVVLNTLEGISDKINVVYANNSAEDAGIYTATATLTAVDAHNYVLVGETTLTKEWKIDPKPVNVSVIGWINNGPFTYDTTEKSVSVDPSTVPVGVEISSVSGNTASDAGIYTATATVKPINSNYVVTGEVASCTWSIETAKIDVSAVEWDYTGPYTYEAGKTWTVKLTGVDGKVEVTYTNNSAVNAGTYTATATLSVKDEYAANYELVGSTELTQTWEIEAAKVAYPSLKSGVFVYNTNAQSIYDVTGDEFFTVTGNTATDAGTYTVIFALKNEGDQINYVWADGKTENYEVEWTIEKDKINVSEYDWNYNTAFVFDGTEKTVALNSYDSKLVVTYTGETAATVVGQYTASVTFQVAEDYQKNYEVTGSVADLTWEIVKDSCEDILFEVEYKYTYTGKYEVGAIVLPANAGTVSFSDFAAADSIVSDLYVEDGKVYIVLAGNAAAGDEGTYAITATMDNYEDVTITVKVALIDRADAGSEIGDFRITYGDAKPEFVGTAAVEGTWQLLTDVSDMVNVGEYEVQVKFVPADTDEYAEKIHNIKLFIDPKVIEVSGVEWDYVPGSFVYNEGVFEVLLKGLPAEVKAEYTNNSAVNAGDYIATAVLKPVNGNYELTGTLQYTLEWTIEKAEINVDGVKWNYTDAFTYDGTEKSVALVNLP